MKITSYNDIRVYNNFSFLNPMILKGSVVSIKCYELNHTDALGIDPT